MKGCLALRPSSSRPQAPACDKLNYSLMLSLWFGVVAVWFTCERALTGLSPPQHVSWAVLTFNSSTHRGGSREGEPVVSKDPPTHVTFPADCHGAFRPSAVHIQYSRM